MKAIMISIKPEFVEKILNGEKTIEIRKTMPKCELPCKVYIYCTKNNGKWIGQYPFYKLCDKKLNDLNGKVVAEFILNKVDTIEICDPFIFRDGEQEDWLYFKAWACLDCEEIMSYIGYGSDHDGWGNEYAKGYAWHIDNLKIYDKPKELSEFSGFIPNNKCEKHENGFACDKCDAYDKEHETCLALYYCHKPIKRPPQSWCYVEEMKSE